MNPFTLAYREQQQLFLYDGRYVAGVLLTTGGLSDLLARFLLQFFRDPIIAIAISILLLCLSSLLLWMTVRESSKDGRSLLLSIAPAFLIWASLADNSLSYAYLTSIITVQALLLIYRKIQAHRLPWGIFLSFLSYIVAGPASIIFTAGACILELRVKASKTWLCLIYLPIWFACALIAYLVADIATLEGALSPSFHYRLDTPMPALHWAGWAAILLAMLISRINQKALKLAAALLLATSALIASHFIATGFENSATGYEYEYHIAREDWDGLAASAKKQAWSPATANYLYLAYARKGILPDNLFKHENYGVSTLLFLPQARTVDVRLAHIMYAMGNIAAAQNVAFNALFTTEGIAPQMLRMNIKIELIRGSYEVAEKYIALLEKSLCYRGWASSMRRFLNNDAAVEADPELGTARRSMRTSEGFVMDGNPVDELMKVVRANPADRGAMQYALSFLLLSNDLHGLQRFVDIYWGAPALGTLPVPVQEALVFYSEYSRNFPGVEPVGLEWCASHGVERETYERFLKYQQASLQSGSKNPRGFTSTYWNYLTSTQE